MLEDISNVLATLVSSPHGVHIFDVSNQSTRMHCRFAV
jgi:hypothetical protein